MTNIVESLKNLLNSKKVDEIQIKIGDFVARANHIDNINGSIIIERKGDIDDVQK